MDKDQVAGQTKSTPPTFSLGEFIVLNGMDEFVHPDNREDVLAAEKVVRITAAPSKDAEDDELVDDFFLVSGAMGLLELQMTMLNEVMGNDYAQVQTLPKSAIEEILASADKVAVVKNKLSDLGDLIKQMAKASDEELSTVGRGDLGVLGSDDEPGVLAAASTEGLKPGVDVNVVGISSKGERIQLGKGQEGLQALLGLLTALGDRKRPH